MRLSTGSCRHGLWLLAFLAALHPCRAGQDESPASTVGLWERWEQRFEAASDADPETNLFIDLISPSGKTRHALGFWDGGRTWRVRFMPDEIGRWTYRTKSAPGVKGLDGQSGTFTCRPQTGTSRFQKHGPVHISADGHYLVHADGTPFFWLADTVWSGALLSRPDDWERFLRDRVAKQFTAIQFVTTHWRAAHTDADGQVAYTGRDRIQIQPKFFQRLDARVDAINANGLLAVPVVLWGLGKDPAHTPGQLPTESATRLARYITARYGSHHVVWFLGGDARYDQPEHWKAIGRATFNGIDHAPVALHAQGRAWPFGQFQQEAWLSVLAYQSGHRVDDDNLRWLVSGPPAQNWSKKPPRPVINAEPPYEDHSNRADSKGTHFTAYEVRRASYWSLLIGPPAGITYGAHGVWSWQEKAGVPLDHPGSGTAKAWPDAMALPGSTHMRYLAELFTSLDWWRLRPDPALLESQPGRDDPTRFVAASRTSEGDLAVVYLPVGGEIALQQGRLPKEMQTEWFDPRSGKRMPAQAVAETRYRAPDDQDWILVIRTAKAR